MILIVMGVSGCGKTTIGRLLAKRLSLPFFDADAFHSPESVQKMSEGIPLTDADREPWLNELSLILQEWESKGGCVLACSALKERYRDTLQKGIQEEIIWVHLDGTKELLQERMMKRSGHYMSPVLLNSQLEALEKPSNAIHISISLNVETILEEILGKIKPSMNESTQFGIIGLGVMGKNLALNLLDKGIQLSVYNRHVSGIEEGVAKEFASGHSQVSGFDDLQLFAASIEKPRKILIMVKAGEAVDYLIEQLLPYLESGDLIMDGGNSNFMDTSRRYRSLLEKNIQYLGVGISGGEEGARNGASIMPGGSLNGYQSAAPYLHKIAAKDKSNNPCCTYVGPEGAGHFVKMVHNGIEYAEMQIIAEIYDVFRNRMGYSPQKIANVFTLWNKEGGGSFLLEITIDILLKNEDQALLLDKVLDAAEQKGTGGLTSKIALDLGVPLSTISEAVTARSISAMKSQRVKADSLYRIFTQAAPSIIITEGQLKNAYQAARIINHAIGFNLIEEASEQYGWKLNLSEIARIWTNGCIIRSDLMDTLSSIFKTQKQLLTHPEMVSQLKASWSDLSLIVSEAVQHGLALPVLSASINYFLGYVRAESPANLIQAQRDYFGAHTYRRKDRKDTEYFHTNWKP